MFHRRRRPAAVAGLDLPEVQRGLLLNQPAAGLEEEEGEGGHPNLIPPGRIAVSWLRDTDGRCHAQEFYEQNRKCKAGLLAQARQISEKGHVSAQPRNGHQLQARFRDLYEMKPGKIYRFMGFRHRAVFYIALGAFKDDKHQDRDYEVALGMRSRFLELHATEEHNRGK